MLNSLRVDLKPPWSERLWYGSVFGVGGLVGAAGVVLSFMKHGTFRFVVGACYFTMFALAFHSLLVAMRSNPPTERLSRRIRFMVLFGLLPWIVLFSIKWFFVK
jgi:hypothetical protein